MKNRQLEHTHHKSTAKKYPLCLLAHDIESPFNIGSLFRITDAFGLEKVFLTGSSAVPPNRKIRKTSRATEKYVDYAYDKNPLTVLKALKTRGYTIICLEITDNSINISKLQIRTDMKICLVLGAENKGVPQALLDVADETVHIPMLGVNSSMNVAMACAVGVYEIIGGLGSGS